MATCLFQACDDDKRFGVCGRLDWATIKASVEKVGIAFLGSQTGGAELRRLTSWVGGCEISLCH